MFTVHPNMLGIPIYVHGLLLLDISGNLGGKKGTLIIMMLAIGYNCHYDYEWIYDQHHHMNNIII